MNASIYQIMLERVRTPRRSDREQVAVILKGAKAAGDYEKALKIAMNCRAGWLTWLTLRQREWQTKLSKRPNRNYKLVSYTDKEKFVKEIDLSCAKTRQQYVECRLY